MGPHSVSAGSPSTTYYNTGVNTSLTGVAIEAGWSGSPRWAVGVEFARPFGRTNLTRRFAYSSPSITASRYRESTFLAIMRVQGPETGQLRAAMVGGFGIVRGSSLQRVSEGRSGSNVFGPLGEEQEFVAGTIAATLGGDVVVAVTRHVAVVPQFRLLVIPRGSVVTGGMFPSFGFNTVLYRGGVGIRVTL